MSAIHSALVTPRETPRRRTLSLGRYVPLVPPATVLLLLFAIPMGMMIGLSFQSRDAAFTLENYNRFFSDDLILGGLLRTIVMSVLVAASVTALAYPLAYYLARSESRWRSVVFALVIAPELAGVVLRTYGWLIILEDHGFINDALMSLGIVSEPVPLSKNMFGVVVGLTHVLLPFGVLSLLPSFQGIDRNHREVRADPRCVSPVGPSAHHPPAVAAGYLEFVLHRLHAFGERICNARADRRGRFSRHGDDGLRTASRSGRLALRGGDGQHPVDHRGWRRLREFADREPAPQQTECVGQRCHEPRCCRSATGWRFARFCFSSRCRYSLS